MANTTEQEMTQWLEDFIDDQTMELAVIAAKIGEDALAISRHDHIYTTQTGNLQSSCGFAVTLNGKPFANPGFKADRNGATGAKQGADYLQECLQQKLSKGISLIMVAGMDYAGFVEDWGGDVLYSAETYVRQEFNKLIRGEI